MCEAIRGMIEEGRLEGVEQGVKALVEVCREFGTSKEDTAAKIKEKFSLAKEEADLFIKKYWEI